MSSSNPTSLDEKLSSAREYYTQNPDPFGLDVDKFSRSFHLLAPIYEHYFRVRVFGTEHLNAYNGSSPRMFIANHTGQLPIDGLLLTMATFLHAKRPLILRSMGERFLMRVPFLGKFALENGVILGDRKNCEICLQRGESVLTFPEGVRGIAKSTPNFYRMQRLSLGFLRMALKYKSPLQPVVVVGAEEMYPVVWQAPSLAKLLKLPAFPITPFFPWLGPAGMLPLPSAIDIYYLPTIELPDLLHSQLADEDLMPFVRELHDRMQNQIDEGRKDQRPALDFKHVWNEHLANHWQEFSRLLRKGSS